MKAKITIEKEYTWEQVADIIDSGKAEETFGFGQLSVEVDGVGTTMLSILGYDKDKSAEDPEAHTMTVWFTDLVFDEMPFDTNGSNKWEKCSLRKNINSVAFKNRFGKDFRKLLTPVLKKNDGGEDTLDTFFLLSDEELKGKERYRRIEAEKDAIKVNRAGETDWHWTRSASRSHASFAWFVHPSGSVYYYDATYAIRFAPACVLSKRREK